MTSLSFWEVLSRAQEYITVRYSALLTDQKQLSQLKTYLEQFLIEQQIEVEGFTTSQLIDRLYAEMAEYSVLTPYLSADNLEEINVNAWNDIALTYTDGRVAKATEHFRSPIHAMDVVKRLLHHSGMVIDNATPIAQGHLPNNTRITVIKEPIVDDGVGVCASIRLLHPNRITRSELIETEMATEEMIAFLELCIRYGVSMVISGATSSGKTTLLNILSDCIPNHKRIYTIEGGARELSARKVNQQTVLNNVVSTLARTADDEKYSVSQEDLVVMSLRFNPDVVIIGEMRDVECCAAVEASLTGHTVLSTVHATTSDAAHTRISLLCQKKYPIDFQTSLTQTALAFPIIVYTHKLENNQRKIMDIAECVVSDEGKRQYRSLYQYQIQENQTADDGLSVTGRFEKTAEPSMLLVRKLMQFGASKQQLQRFIKKEEIR